LESARAADQAEEHLLATAVSLSKRVKVFQLVIDVGKIIGNQTYLRSLTSPRAKRISGPKKFRSSPKKDFFNTIRQKRTFPSSQFLNPRRTLSGIARRGI